MLFVTGFAIIGHIINDDYVTSQLDTIQKWLIENSEPAYRYKQIERAWFSVSNWGQVTTIPLDLRSALTKKFGWISLAGTKVLTSPIDGTKKAILTLHDGSKIEAVLMPNARGKYTVCVSSQVGCGMGCTFCATGKMGLKRNLTPDEIVDQVRFWRFTQPDCMVSNIVFMGMGEPMVNYEAVRQSLHILIDQMHIAPTHITVSTVGVSVILNKILKDTEFPPVRIAFSLHAGTDATRLSIVPSHKTTSMKKIVDWAQMYIDTLSNRRHHLTFEYVMLAGVNDMPTEAKALVKLFAPIKHRIKFNLIPWNPIGKEFHTSKEQALHVFADILEQAGFTTTIRYSKGLDISAACGQLIVKEAKQPAKTA